VRANIGSMYFKMGRLPEAIAHYEEAIALNPNLAGAHWNLGKVYHKKRQHRSGDRLFSENILTQPPASRCRLPL
jgi:Tetratricopeptide repeat.